MSQPFKKYIIILILFLFSVKGYACKCFTRSTQDYFSISDFVATAKITSIKPSQTNKNFHDIEIELIHLYKGKVVKKLIIERLLSPCAFPLPQGSTWLIFASYDKNNEPNFDYCSGSSQIDKKFDPNLFPTGEATYKSNMDIKLSVLSFLQKKKITNTNPDSLSISSTDDFIDTLGELGEKKAYSIIELIINTDLSIKSVKSIKKFENPKLKKKLEEFVSSMTFTVPKNKNIPSKTKLYLVYYYYPAGRTEFGYLSTWNL